MKTRIIIENWTKVDTEEYQQIVDLQHIPRIGERFTFEKASSDGDYETYLYVVDVVNQFLDGYHNIIVILSNDLECVSNFYYRED